MPGPLLLLLLLLSLVSRGLAVWRSGIGHSVCERTLSCEGRDGAVCGEGAASCPRTCLV